MAKANLLGMRKPEDNLENRPVLKRHKESSEEKETRKNLVDWLQQIERRVELLETKVDQANLISVKEPAVTEKTLMIWHLPIQAEISDIIDFFIDVGQVVRVSIQVTDQCIQRAAAFVEFASANEAKKAVQKKNCGKFLDRQIVLANRRAAYTPFKRCIDYKVWYKDEDYPQQEDDQPPHFVEEVLFIANLSPQTTRISHIIDFFKDVADVVSVRLIVNHEGKHVGYAFVEFPSAHQAKWAMENKNGEYLHDHKILLMKLEGLDKTPDSVEDVAVREKTLSLANLSHETQISHIINLFKDAGEVVHVRLMVDIYNGEHVGNGFVEFASADGAKKALEMKNGEYLHDRQIFLDVVKADPCPPRPKYCIDHKVWYEDYIRQESLLIEGLDTPDFAEELAVREKTVFVANLSMEKDALCDISNMIKVFKSVGEVVRVRLIVDGLGEHVGCGFFELASASEAKKAVEEKNSRWLYVNVAEPEIAPYPIRPKYNLYNLAEKLWYEDNLRREDLGNLPKKQEVTFLGTKVTFDEQTEETEGNLPW